MKKLIYVLLVFAIILLIQGIIMNHAVGSLSREENLSKKDYTVAAVPSKSKGLEIIPEKTSSEDWQLTLVSSKNPLSNTFKPVLKNLSNGEKFDERAIGQLNAMLAAARVQGLSPVICSAYRTIGYQRKLFNNQVNKQKSKGLDQEQSENEARKVIAYPGTSEHNLGLAADIVSIKYQILDKAQADTAEVKWLIEHCSEYGFILRYPEDKTEITGVSYEPWHFRYVGMDHAKEIMKKGLCLEEYLNTGYDTLNNK